MKIGSEYSKTVSKEIKRLKRYSLFFSLVWAILLAASLLWNIFSIYTHVETLAKANARSYIKTELTFRNWVLNHGGLYSLLDQNSQKDYNFANSNPEIISPNKDTLILINPPYTIIHINKDPVDSTNIFSHLTSLNPIKKENLPDSWEKKALLNFESGTKEFVEFTDIEKKEFLRLMQPILAERRCLKCHELQGFKVGDIIGGISATVPMKPLWVKSNNDILRNISLHISFLLVGLFAIRSVRKRFEKRIIINQNAQKTILESEQKYRLLANQKGQMVYAYDINSNKINWEGDLIEKLGFSNEEFQSIDFELLGQMLHHEDQSIVEEQFSLRLKQCDNFNLEYRIKTKDGNYCFVEDSYTFLTDADKKPIKIFGLIKDVTDKKLAILKLEESEKNYRILAENSVDFIWKIDLDFNFLYVSPEIYHLTGYSVDEIMKINAKALLPPKKLKEMIGYINEAISFGKDAPGKTFESVYIRKNGLEISVEISCKIIWDTNENPIGINGYTKNIKERKIVEQTLKESEMRFRMTFDQAFDPIFISEIIEGQIPKIVDINKAVTTKLGHKREDLIGKPMNSFNVNETKENILERVTKIISGEPLNFESVHKKNDGTLIPVEVSAKKIDLNGKNYVYIIQRDISERKQWENEILKIQANLKEEIASKNKFFSIISHDLKSPFGTLLSIFQLLEETFDELSDKEKKEMIHVGRNSSKNIFQLLEGLLEWSRLTIGRMEFSPRNINLEELSTQTILLLSQNAKSKSIKFINEINGNYFVFADTKMLRTVLINLLTNAIKFTAKGGEIKLLSQIFDDKIEISVADNGVGINPIDLAKLFRIDVHHTTVGTENETGTGVGLILCKELVEKNGGTIWAESEFGKGSTFKFTIPKSQYLA